jgi:uncharacterized damage-inducible protein DinB
MTVRFKDSVFQRILDEDLASIADPAAALPDHNAEAQAFLRALPEEKRGYAYAPGKWTVGQVVGHLADAQLVFLGRILFIARGQGAALPGFDEDRWIVSSGHAGKSLAELRDLLARGAALAEALVQSLPAGAMDKEGEANGILITPSEILAYLIAHEKHHLRVIRERYLR